MNDKQAAEPSDSPVYVYIYNPIPSFFLNILFVIFLMEKHNFCIPIITFV